MTEICTNKELYEFSWEHLTYINQIFGDELVREIITTTFPNKKLEFGIEETGEDFEHSYHHFIIEKKTGQHICSVDKGYQNMDVNINDNLCQSYSLLTYFGIPIDPDQKKRQMDMIAMYRKMLTRKKFIKNLDQVIHNENGNDKIWINQKGDDTETFVVMDKAAILQKINEVLNKWEAFGFWYFIGNGKCPRVAKTANKMTRPITPRGPSQRISTNNQLATVFRMSTRNNNGNTNNNNTRRSTRQRTPRGGEKKK